MRRAFWDKVASLTTAGLHHTSVVDEIDCLYKNQGCKNMTDILRAMKRDRKNGIVYNSLNVMPRR